MLWHNEQVYNRSVIQRILGEPVYSCSFQNSRVNQSLELLKMYPCSWYLKKITIIGYWQHQILGYWCIGNIKWGRSVITLTSNILLEMPLTVFPSLLLVTIEPKNTRTLILHPSIGNDIYKDMHCVLGWFC